MSCTMSVAETCSSHECLRPLPAPFCLLPLTDNWTTFPSVPQVRGLPVREFRPVEYDQDGCGLSEVWPVKTAQDYPHPLSLAEYRELQKAKGRWGNMKPRWGSLNDCMGRLPPLLSAPFRPTMGGNMSNEKAFVALSHPNVGDCLFPS